MEVLRAQLPEASPIHTTKLKQPALHWAQVVSVTAILTSDLVWQPSGMPFFFLLEEQAMQTVFFNDFDEAVCSGASFL